MLNWIFSHCFAGRNQQIINEAFAAIKEKNMLQMKTLFLNNKLDPNARDARGWTLLHAVILVTHHANQNEMVVLLKILIQRGADINKLYVTNAHNISPLHSSIRRNLPIITELLLGNNADISVKDKAGKTAEDYRLR